MSRKCKDGFIQTYLKYTENQSSPVIFHIWTAIGIISATLGRRVWIDMGGYYSLFPNLYIALVSPSGVGKKSTAMDLGIKLLDNAELDVDVLKGKITPARLVDRLIATSLKKDRDGRAELLVYAREFRVFLKGIVTDSSLIEDMTDLYDCGKFEYETKKDGSSWIHKPCVTLLAGTTPEWLTAGKSGDIMSGGLGARLIAVCVTEEEKDEAWPEMHPAQREAYEDVASDLNEIKNLEGKFYITQEAKDFYEQWYKKRNNYRIEDKRLDAYYSKKHDMVRKVAMVLSASMSNELVIQVNHFKSALALFTNLEASIQFAYSGVVSNDRMRYIDMIANEIKKNGKISQGQLSRMFGHALDKKGLEVVIETLKVQGRIEEEIVTIKGKPGIGYKWVKED